MAEIHHIDQAVSREELTRRLLAHYKAMDSGSFLAQQCLLHGAADALHQLIRYGGPSEIAESMLGDVMFQLGVMKGYAEENGLTMLDLKLPRGLVN